MPPPVMITDYESAVYFTTSGTNYDMTAVHNPHAEEQIGLNATPEDVTMDEADDARDGQADMDVDRVNKSDVGQENVVHQGRPGQVAIQWCFVDKVDLKWLVGAALWEALEDVKGFLETA